jgi:hypothetical protein
LHEKYKLIFDLSLYKLFGFNAQIAILEMPVHNPGLASVDFSDARRKPGNFQVGSGASFTPVQ